PSCHARFNLSQFGCDDAFGVGQRLLPKPAQLLQVLADGIGATGLALVVVRRLSALRGRDFQVVAEDLVVADSSAPNASALTLTDLERGDPLAGVASEGAVLIE